MISFPVSSCDLVPGEFLPLPFLPLPYLSCGLLMFFLPFGTDFPILISSLWESFGFTGSVYSGFGKLVYTVPAVNRVNIGRLLDNTHKMV